MPRKRQTKMLEDWTILFQCPNCKEFKPCEDYAIDKRAKDWIQSKCKSCNLEYRDAHKLQTRIHNAIYKHNFTEEEAINYINSPLFLEARKPKVINWIETFKCNHCNNYYPTTEFLSWRSGYPKARCKQCRALYRKEYNKRKVEENWYNLWTFHSRALNFKKKYGIEFRWCTICDRHDDIEMHHPSYKSEEMREYVVPLCPSCHRKVHTWWLSCPAPIKLTNLINKKQNDLRKNIRTISKKQARGEDIFIWKSPKTNEKEPTNKDKK